MDKYRGLKKVAKLCMVAVINREKLELSGNQAIAIIYGCKHDSDLNLEFIEKVASSSSYLPPECPPPTPYSARLHSQRVYLQVQA